MEIMSSVVTEYRFNYPKILNKKSSNVKNLNIFKSSLIFYNPEGKKNKAWHVLEIFPMQLTKLKKGYKLLQILIYRFLF